MWFASKKFSASSCLGKKGLCTRHKKLDLFTISAVQCPGFSLLRHAMQAFLFFRGILLLPQVSRSFDRWVRFRIEQLLKVFSMRRLIWAYSVEPTYICSTLTLNQLNSTVQQRFTCKLLWQDMSKLSRSKKRFSGLSQLKSTKWMISYFWQATSMLMQLSLSELNNALNMMKSRRTISLSLSYP